MRGVGMGPPGPMIGGPPPPGFMGPPNMTRPGPPFMGPPGPGPGPQVMPMEHMPTPMPPSQPQIPAIVR
jgi:hypothetical protein